MTDSQNFEFASVRNGKASMPNTKPYTRVSKKVVLDLPPPGAMRWGVRSKAAVVNAVRSGLLTLDEARHRYALSISEYLTWENTLDTAGPEGLRMASRQLRRRNMTASAK
jgi:hypothetical protein